jgi:hypothetical protein
MSACFRKEAISWCDLESCYRFSPGYQGFPYSFVQMQKTFDEEIFIIKYLPVLVGSRIGSSSEVGKWTPSAETVG